MQMHATTYECWSCLWADCACAQARLRGRNYCNNLDRWYASRVNGSDMLRTRDVDVQQFRSLGIMTDINVQSRQGL